jgi:hypothetical protein
MCPSDEWGIKGPHELLRFWFDYQGWFDIKTRDFNKVKNLQMCATVSLADASHYSTKHLGERFTWRWALITMVNLNQDHIREIYAQILHWVIPSWDASLAKRDKEISDKVLKSSFEFFKYLDHKLPNTPDRFTKKVNQRHMLSALFGLIDCNMRWKATMDDVATVFIHEMARATMDRIVSESDKEETFEKLTDIVKQNFDYEPSKKKRRIDANVPLYSYLKRDQTEFYHKMLDGCK